MGTAINGNIGSTLAAQWPMFGQALYPYPDGYDRLEPFIGWQSCIYLMEAYRFLGSTQNASGTRATNALWRSIRTLARRIAKAG